MLVWVSSSDTSGMAPTPQWRDEALGQIVCRRCGRLDRRWYPKQVDIHFLEHEDGPILLAGFRTPLRAFRRDFIDQIRPCMRDFIFGRCYDNKGREVKRYVTAYTKNWLVEHRDESTKYVRCPECGIFNSNVVLPPGYVLRHELPPGPVYQGCAGALYLDVDLADRVDWSPFPDVRLHRFEIRDTPLAGWRSPDDPDIPEWGAGTADAERRMREQWLDKWLKPPGT